MDYSILLTLLGGGSITGLVGWFLGGKQAKKQELKKGDVEIKLTEIDYAVKVRELYESFNQKLTQENENLSKDITELRTHVNNLQKQFNDLYISYAKEVESSKYWKDKFDDLENKYRILEQDHESLKKQFENYKKLNK